MCWNERVSLNTFLFSMFAASMALKNGVGTTPDVMFYMFFSTMQLIEYFLWKNLDNKEANAFWSRIGLLLIVLQPIVSMWAIKDAKKKNVLLSLYILGALIVFTIVKPIGTINFSSHRAPNGHLAWDWLDFPKWVFVGFIFFQLISLFLNGLYLRLFVALATVILIYFTYVKSGTWGSMWCWISNMLGLSLLFEVFRNSLC